MNNYHGLTADLGHVAALDTYVAVRTLLPRPGDAGGHCPVTAAGEYAAPFLRSIWHTTGTK